MTLGEERFGLLEPPPAQLTASASFVQICTDGDVSSSPDASYEVIIGVVYMAPTPRRYLTMPTGYLFHSLLNLNLIH